MDLLLCHHVPPPSCPPVSPPSSMSPCSFLPPEVFRVSLAYSASCREGWQTRIIYFTPCTFLENIFHKFLQNGLKGSRVQLRPLLFVVSICTLCGPAPKTQMHVEDRTPSAFITCVSSVQLLLL